MVAAIVYLIMKLMFWHRFSAGIAPLLIGVFFSEHCSCSLSDSSENMVLSINTRVLDRPLVVEEERLNFDEEETEKEEDAQ